MKSVLSSLIICLCIVLIGFAGCWYKQDDQHHPTGPDRTGVQGWTILMTITPSTVPANNSSTLDAEIKFWDLADRTGVSGQNIYLSIYNADGSSPALASEVHFADGGTTLLVTTDSLGLAQARMYVGYLSRTVTEKFYILRAEATIDFDNNATDIWNTHLFRLYNPYWATPTPIPTITPTPTPPATP